MLVFFGIIGLLILAAIPSDWVMHWLLMRHLPEYQVGGRPIPHVYFARAPYEVAGILALDFIKGFWGFWAMDFLFGIDNWLLLLLIPLFLLSHYRPFFLKFEQVRPLLMVILGLYCYISWPLGLVFFIGFLILSLLLNSFLIGLIGMVLVQFSFIWTSELNPMFFLFNFVIFVFLVLVYHQEVFWHFEEKPITLLHSFRNRG